MKHFLNHSFFAPLFLLLSINSLNNASSHALFYLYDVLPSVEVPVVILQCCWWDICYISALYADVEAIC